MSDTMQTCALPGCENQFAIQDRGRHRKYCSANHRLKHHLILKEEKLKNGLGAVEEEPNERPATSFDVQTQIPFSLPQKKTFLENKQPPRMDISKPAAQDIHTQWVFESQRKEIDRWEKAYHDEVAARKKLHEENDKLRSDLAELKTDVRIKKMEDEHRKPSGLQGFTSSMEGFLNNPHIGPHIGALVGKILGTVTGQLGAPSSDETAQAAQQIMGWYQTQSHDVQQAFNDLINGIAGVEPARLPQVLRQMVNSINANQPVMKATMGYA